MKERQKTYINIHCNLHKAVWTDNPCKKINIQTFCEHEYVADAMSFTSRSRRLVGRVFWRAGLPTAVEGRWSLPAASYRRGHWLLQSPRWVGKKNNRDLNESTRSDCYCSLNRWAASPREIFKLRWNRFYSLLVIKQPQLLFFKTNM